MKKIKSIIILSIVLLGISCEDVDSDGFVRAYDCNDNDPNINPFATDNPSTSVDESCGATLGTYKVGLEELGFYINSNPNDGNFSIISTNFDKYQVGLFSISGKRISKKTGSGVIEFKNIGSAGVYILRIAQAGKLVGTTKIVVK